LTNKCAKCHSVDKKKDGPAFKVTAAKYKGKADGEAMRVTKPGGKIVFVDYHKPRTLSPFRYLMVPILTTLEPFAMDLWNGQIADWLPSDCQHLRIDKQTYFGGLYQKVVITR
jgi:ubiquinone/menaquinone biosynthesis C-methylase UbiE